MKSYIIALAVALVFTPFAGAAAGDLDPTFDGDGIAVTDFASGSDDVAESVAVQGDGKIVVTGTTVWPAPSGELRPVGFALTRYTVSGAPDPTFDGDGKAATTFPPSLRAEAYASAIQADGKLLAAGRVLVQDASPPRYFDFALARFRSEDGTLDPSFDGDGEVMTDFASTYDAANALTLQPDGKIILAGTSGSSAAFDVALARYNPDGSLDNSFDGDGKVVTGVSEGSNEETIGIAVRLQADGRIVVGGFSWIGGGTEAFLLRYMPDGSLDASFDGDGKRVITTPITQISDLALQADGKIVVAGAPYLVRFNADGSLDTSFAGGQWIRPLGNGGVSALTTQADGKIVAAGILITRYWEDAGDFAVARLTPEGAFDVGFGLGGMATTDIGPYDLAQGVALTPDGNIAVAGLTGPDHRLGESGPNDLAVARYLGAGAPSPPLPPPPPPSPPPPVRPPPPGTQVRCVVPNVKRKTVAKAKATLRARRCAPGRIKYAFHPAIKKGRVIAQSRRAGTRYRRGTKVNLIVSKGRRRA